MDPILQDTHYDVRRQPESKEAVERRFSSRLRDRPEEKRPYYGDVKRKGLLSGKGINDGGGGGKKKRTKFDCTMRRNPVNGGGRKNGGFDSLSIKAAGDGEIELDSAYLKLTDYDSFIAQSIQHNTLITKVKEQSRDFNELCLHCDQEEEKRYEEAKMLEKQDIPYPEKQFDHLPGIHVGHKFFSEAEMVLTGFHGHWSSGIDYIRKFCVKQNKHNGFNFPVAVAILLSVQYKDDADYSNEVVYTGQDLLNSKHQVEDQVMPGANLVLKNNMEQSIPVRIICRHRCPQNDGNQGSKVYTYCGLYKVVCRWSRRGAYGFDSFKYCLKLILGQPKIEINQVDFLGGRSGVPYDLPGLVCKDISFGEEDIRIPVINEIDNPPIAPPPFKYMKSIEFSKNVIIPPSPSGCNCKGECTNASSCSCAKLNGKDFPYVRKDGGRLVEPKSVVFECSPGCGCGPNCINRVSQHGLKHQLEVYRTEKKGWAVRSRDFIPSGAPVCEYTGIVKRNVELDNESANDYIFEIDCWHTIKEIGGREKRQGDLPASAHDIVMKADDKLEGRESEFCIDAGSCGNVSRFINHSCEPNLFVQCILSSHQDVRLARVMLFSAEDIPPMQELAYDYCYELDSVVGSAGEIKKAPCCCGTNECRGRLY